MYRLWKDISPDSNWDEGTWDEVLPNQSTVMKRVKVGLKNKKDAEVPPLVTAVVTAATGKVELATSPVTLASLTTLVGEGQTLLDEEAATRDAWLAKRTARIDKFRTLRTDIKRYAEFANVVYQGDKLLLQSIGLDVVELGVPVGVLPAPGNLRTMAGPLDGTVKLRWAYTRGRDFYEAQCAESANGPWTQFYQGKLSAGTCSGLESGKEYFFRVRAHGPAGEGAWSDISKKRAS